uniref:Reverse transcriptase domain-containing protein n=1 Tax=Tanacetum cinerariifolium TaxID=118510 RepID=A0A6L2LBX6_TANCI|nr:hypothetical protein [Tanacetum cinerariifolium]
MNQNYLKPNPCYDSNSSGFDHFQPPQYPVVHQPPQETSTKILQAREDLMEAIQVFLKKYDQIPSEEKCIALLRAEEKFFKVKQALEEEQNQREIIQELLLQLIHDFLDGDDDDDDYDNESLISTNMDIFETPPSIVITTSPPVLPTEDHKDSLIMRNKELNTIPKKESNEFIKSSIEDLVPIPSESEDTSESDSEWILPSCDNFSPIDIPEEKAMIFSNPLFNSNDDFISSDDESLSDEDIPEDNVKIYSNPLFEFDDEYISSDVNPLLMRCNDVELLLHHDPSIPKMSVASILEGFTDELPLEENDELFDLEPKNDEWKKILIAPDLEASRACGFVHRPFEI